MQLHPTECRVQSFIQAYRLGILTSDEMVDGVRREVNRAVALYKARVDAIRYSLIDHKDWVDRAMQRFIDAADLPADSDVPDHIKDARDSFVKAAQSLRLVP